MTDVAAMAEHDVSGAELGELTTIDGIECYRIADVDRLEPFLTTVVSDSDLWMFVSSAGSLTAGRIDADHAVFPYLTDDHLHRGAGTIGPVTVLARTTEGRRELWRPFHAETSPGCRRSLAKSITSDRLVFEEVNAVWGLHVRATWTPARNFGWIRRVEITALDAACEVEVLDGLLDIMPSGVNAATEQLQSNLVNAFKRSQIVGEAGRLAVYNLEALITDRAEPGESLTSTAVWSWGLDEALLDLDARSLRRFLVGDDRRSMRLVTGQPGAYLLTSPVLLRPGERSSWSIAIDTDLDHVDLAALKTAVSDPAIPAQVENEVADGSARLRAMLGDADGIQRTGDRIADAHHLSNVLFNSMRGGVFPYEHRVPTEDFANFVAVRNHDIASRYGEWIAALEPWLDVKELRVQAQATGDPDLVRLVLEYLPLTFSRRHGDPSRPWNQFSIHVTDQQGNGVLRYEGNWRDIFQNWEALLHSYPSYFVNVIAKFVNASTLDGYNPYRITQEGVDWEVPDPHDPWANIGYWGDHQIVYLLRLLEAWDRYEPAAAEPWLDQPVFTYADVPYRISDRPQMIADPRNTINFLDKRAEAIAEREASLGTDGRLTVDTAGEILRVGLAEKLLVPALSKLCNLVPGAGIWMNTQRPEWNDANNALAGPGVSMVTVFHLHRYLRRLRALLSERATVVLSTSVASWLAELAAVYRDHEPEIGDDTARRTMVDALGAVADAHSRRLLAGVHPSSEHVACSDIVALINNALDHLAASMEAADRHDGLVDSYNVVAFPSNSTATVRPLGPMLEGQVAALACGHLTSGQALAIVEALYKSAMYRADLDTFMLYPEVSPAPFLERNIVPPGALSARAEIVLPSVLARDSDGHLRFRPAAVNAKALHQLMDCDSASDELREEVADAYEAVFGHSSFTGRSGSMYGYEGIGSVYWHMVSKLLLAVQETYWTALDSGEPPEIAEALAAAYRRLRHGLGFAKGPKLYGAFPIDCYSHSPAHSGAQQPGMTGQVKEQLIARLGEIGLRVLDGQLVMRPGLLPTAEVFGADGSGTASFTFCAVPMTVRLGAGAEIEFVSGAGGITVKPGTSLTRAETAAVLARRGDVTAVNWTVAH